MEIKKLIAILSLLLFAAGSYVVKTGKMQHHSATTVSGEAAKAQ